MPAEACHERSLFGRVPSHAQQVIVVGMTRSGSSLTASLVAALLGRENVSWRGSGTEYPRDAHNRLGYYEREDVVALNYAILSSLGVPSWISFPPDHARRPRTLRPTVCRQLRSCVALESKARRIVTDMDAHAPWVLKDARFARTLPAWWPLRPLVAAVRDTVSTPGRGGLFVASAD